ncbi:unnamed protein product [Closterium sp. NIES-65]|nr:unnamed protein product [Closterium sp. NIES-65]
MAVLTSPPNSLPYVVALNCMEGCHAQAEALADLCVLENVGLSEGMLDKLERADVVLVHSLHYLPRAAQRKLSASQLILCLGSSADTRPVESSLAEELGLRLVHVDVPRTDEVADSVMALMLGGVGGALGGAGGALGGVGGALGGVGGALGGVGGALGGVGGALGGVGGALGGVGGALGAQELQRSPRAAALMRAVGTERSTVEAVLAASDVVSLHVALTDSTLHLINDDTAKHFKKGRHTHGQWGEEGGVCEAFRRSMGGRWEREVSLPVLESTQKLLLTQPAPHPSRRHANQRQPLLPGAMLVNVSSCHLVSDSAIKRALKSPFSSPSWPFLFPPGAMLVNASSALRSAMLVNASSCHLVSDSAIKRALNSGRLGSCALDGVEGNQWLEAWVREFPNVLILPRSADYSQEVWEALQSKAVAVVRAFLTSGKVPEELVLDESFGGVEGEEEEEEEESQWQALHALFPSSSAARAGAAANGGDGGGGVGGKKAGRAGWGGRAEEGRRGGGDGSKSGSSGGKKQGGERRGDTQADALTASVEKVGIPSRLLSAPSHHSPLTLSLLSLPLRSFFLLSVDLLLSSRPHAFSPQLASLYPTHVLSFHLSLPPHASLSSLSPSILLSLRPNQHLPDCPLQDGMLVALQPLSSTSSSASSSSLSLPAAFAAAFPKALFAAKRHQGGASWRFAPVEGISTQHPSVQFVIVCDKDLLGCRSVFAGGKFLQATEGGELLLVNDDLDLAESWWNFRCSSTS